MVYLNLIARTVFSLFYVLLVARAFTPWLSDRLPDNWLRLLSAATDWLLGPIRAGLPPEKIGYDVSPYVAIIVLYLIQRVFFK